MRIFNKEISNGAVIMVGAVVVIVLLIGSIFLGILPGSRPQKVGQATLEFWGLFDSGSVWQPLFDEYKKTHSNNTFSNRRRIYHNVIYSHWNKQRICCSCWATYSRIFYNTL